LVWAQAEEAPRVEAPAGVDETRLREAARRRGLALADLEEGNYGRAAEHLEELARLLPDNILPPVNLAICYFRLNRQEDALRELERARTLDPDNPQVLYAAARILGQEPGQEERAREVIHHFLATHPHDVRPYYLEAEALEREGRFGEVVAELERGLEEEPENLVLLGDLLVAAAAGKDGESVADAVNAIEDRVDGFDESLADYAGQIRDAVEEGRLEGLRPLAVVMRNLLRPTELYQVHLVPLIGTGVAGGGMFPQQDFDPPLPKSIQGGEDIEIAFEDAMGLLQPGQELEELLAVVATRPGVEGLLSSGRGRLLLSEVTDGEALTRSVEVTPPVKGLAMVHAVDQDEIADLVTADSSSGVRLYRGEADGLFAPAKEILGPLGDPEFLTLHPLDLDHDGDLDLFVGRQGAEDLYLQNNGDGTWTERARELAIAGPSVDTTDMTLADFDDDGDLDLLTVHPSNRPRLYLNPRLGAFRPAGDESLALLAIGHSRVRSADFDNDGRFDLLFWGGGERELLLNRWPAFELAELPEELPRRWAAAEIGDFDNDGDQDLMMVAAAAGPPVLVRNRHGEFTVEQIGPSVSGIEGLRKGDFDDDGDLDLIARTAGGDLRFWRNQGGNRNHWVRLSLKGRYDNNSKNNVRGLFCRVETRVGDSYQATLGNGVVNHLGLGARRQADVIRVVWTNGIAQTWQLVSADRTLVEEQMLKGSCPFLYTWNGEEFEFVTDLMWKSPLGMILADGSPAPHQSARDFVMVPGEALREVGGELWLQVTEELWETAYVDRQYLLAVDHPVGVEMVVDERFLPPPYAADPPIHWVGERLLPVAARDHRGRDVLEKLRRRDGDHVDGLPLSRYQGLTKGQSLEMRFSDVPAGERLRLALWGWIFPTDTSINFALAQDSSRSPEGPSLEVLDEDGRWRTLYPFIGFPNGKRKAMVVELTDLLPAGSVALRIATSLQIYWDAAALVVGGPEPDPVVTRLEPRQADLHYRGYSRLYRESSSGPHLFDYSTVGVGPRFRDMRGFFTRYGPVTELLEGEDDRYVVMNAGDEMTVRFDAARLPPLRPGWRRDFVLYTDGWVKDGDIHTAFSQSVEPLPYHGMGAYPANPEHSYPDDREHREYLERYQTRGVSDRPFRESLK
jgi:hypothetical protein